MVAGGDGGLGWCGVMASGGGGTGGLGWCGVVAGGGGGTGGLGWCGVVAGGGGVRRGFVCGGKTGSLDCCGLVLLAAAGGGTMGLDWCGVGGTFSLSKFHRTILARLRWVVLLLVMPRAFNGLWSYELALLTSSLHYYEQH